MPPLTVARLVICGHRPRTADEAELETLGALHRMSAQGLRASVLQMPGGFVRGRLQCPQEAAGWQGRVESSSVLSEASKALLGAATGRVLRAASGVVDFLTLGVDLYDRQQRCHAELVGVLDVLAATTDELEEAILWTGKSYPTASEERTLVRVADLGTHCMRLADHRALVLGCNDLSLWSPRGIAEQVPGSQRARVRAEMLALVADFRPTLVLQHPHFTDTPTVWGASWRHLLSMTPSVRTWSGAVRYVRPTSLYGKQRAITPRAPLSEVLAGTSSRGVADILSPTCERGARRVEA